MAPIDDKPSRFYPSAQPLQDVIGQAYDAGVLTSAEATAMLEELWKPCAHCVRDGREPRKGKFLVEQTPLCAEHVALEFAARRRQR